MAAVVVNPAGAGRSKVILVLLAITAAAVGLLALALFSLHGDGPLARQLLTRYTARLAALLLAVVFATSGLAELRPSRLTRAMLLHRRALGLAFALAFFVHLGAILLQRGRSLFVEGSALGLVGGAVPYTFAGLMALTSSDRAVAWLGARRWKRLHRTGIYLLWVVFVVTYAGGAADNGFQLVMLLILLAAGAVRMAAFFKRRLRFAAKASPVSDGLDPRW